MSDEISEAYDDVDRETSKTYTSTQNIGIELVQSSIETEANKTVDKSEISGGEEEETEGMDSISRNSLKLDLASKLKNIPIDQLREILTHQLDLEIRLKHRELKLTDEEIGKCESQMIALRNFFEIPSEVKIESEPNDFTIKYFNLLNKALTVNYAEIKSNTTDQSYPIANQNRSEVDPSIEAGHSYRTRSTTSSLRPSSLLVQRQNLGCLYRRTDGIIVRLTCPDCHRSNFSSAQGFLNHSRIAHSKEYTSQDAAALRCGEILSVIEQDEEGLASLKSLKEKGLDPDKNLNVNEIYFNGLSQTLNTVHKNAPFDDRGISPLEKDFKECQVPEQPPKPDESSLMKKLMQNGVTTSEDDYNVLLEEAKRPIPNAHLFNDEEEELDLVMEAKLLTPSNITDMKKLKRRKSRGGINILMSTSAPDDANVSPDMEKAPSPSSAASENSRSNSPNVTLPKIKLKLRPPTEDSKRRKKN